MMRSVEIRVWRWLPVCLGSMVFWACLASSPAAHAEVIVNFTTTNGWIYHGGQRVNGNSLPGQFGPIATHFNQQPVKAPFLSPTGEGGRYASHPFYAVNATWFYSRLDGAGTFQFSQTGTVPVLSPARPQGNGSFGAMGSQLPTAGMTGILPSALALPTGLTLPQGTLLYADFSGLTADFDNPAQWWYDAASQTQHQVYSGGQWAFYFDNGAGGFDVLAEYEDVTLAAEFRLGAGTAQYTWTATPVVTNDLILPLTAGFMGGSALIPISGVINEELVSPTVGFFSSAGQSLTFAFDVDNATAVPEASTVTLLGTAWAAMYTLAWRRRRIQRDAKGSVAR